jgi:hypothetical protein
MLSVFPQWGFTFIYIRLITSNDVSIGTIGPTSITQNIINNYHINYLLHYGGADLYPLHHK